MSNPDTDLNDEITFRADAAAADQERERMEEISELDHRDDMKEDQFMSDAEADADVLASAGYGTDEDYGCFCGGEE